MSKQTSFKIHNTIWLLASFTAVILTLALLNEYHKVQIWQHDSALYDLRGHFHKILTEGRWLNPYLATFTVKLGGYYSALISLVSLFAFFKVIFLRATNHWQYSLVLACLCVQALPLSHQLMWPVVLAPICLILLSSSLIVKRIPMIAFYCLYGMAFFATLSSFYYLLPLCHLYLLRSEDDLENVTYFICKILPSWAIGFIVGYLSMKAMVYFFNDRAFGVGSFNLKIADWREPNPVSDHLTLYLNTLSSIGYLQQHLSLFFTNPSVLILGLLALLTKTRKLMTRSLLSTTSIGLSILIAHYVLIIPLGLRFELRTALSTWIGTSLILFYATHLTHRARTTLIILAVITSWVSLSHNSKVIGRYTTLTNTYLDDLNTLFDKPAESFKGIILHASQDQFHSTTQRVFEEKTIENQLILWGPHLFRWRPIAIEAGFKTVHICSPKDLTEPICSSTESLDSNTSAINKKTSLTTEVIGIQDGYLVVKFTR